jgi:hypothetical protein
VDGKYTWARFQLMSLLDADRRIIEVCGLVRQPIVNNPFGCQQADAAKQGHGRLVILPIVSFICAKNIVGWGSHLGWPNAIFQVDYQQIYN